MDRREADKMYHKVRILCIVPTIQEHVDSGHVQMVNVTWGRKCNKILFSLCPKEHRHDFIKTCMFSENKKNLIGKITFSFFYVYKNYINEFDWILKADDDTYIVIENLRYLLSHYDSNSPGYTGYHFKAFVYNGYNSGGAGYAISRQGVKQMIEYGYQKGLCAMNGEVEDLEIGRCLEVRDL